MSHLVSRGDGQGDVEAGLGAAEQCCVLLALDAHAPRVFTATQLRV